MVGANPHQSEASAKIDARGEHAHAAEPIAERAAGKDQRGEHQR
jgi:hypothetical protein